MTASNYSGREERGRDGGIEEGKMAPCLFKCHFYEVNASRLLFSLFFFLPLLRYTGISHNGKTFLAMFHSVRASPLSFCLARAASLAAGFKPCEALPAS